MAVFEVICRVCKKSFYFQPARGSCKINLMVFGLCPNCLKELKGSQEYPDVKRIE